MGQTFVDRAGVPVEIRRLKGSERPTYAAHLCRLGRDERAMRFGRAVSDTFATAHALEAGGVLFGAFVDGALRAVGELQTLAARKVEAALSVEREFRRRGIGGELMRRMVLSARNRNSRVLLTLCRGDNRAMVRLAVRAGAKVTREGPEAFATLALDPPSPFTAWREAFAETPTGAHTPFGRWVDLILPPAAAASSP